MTQTATVSTPAGPFTVVVDSDGAMLAAGFAPDARSLHGAAELDARERSSIPGVTDRVAAYFGGDVHAIDSLAVRQEGTPAFRRAWDAMRSVPPGRSIAYGELARAMGSPGAARAAGSACARNRVALVVPCHRVVPSGGGVGHYGFGSDVKRWLLEHELRNA